MRRRVISRERIPGKWNRFADKDTLQIPRFEQILVAKVLHTFAGFALAAALGLAAGAAQAQSKDPSFNLDLIGSEPKNGTCAFIFDAQNKLGVDLADIKVQIIALAANGVYEGLWLLSFSDIKDRKRQIKSFQLPKSCEEIGKFNVNFFTECKGDKDYKDLCNKGLQASSKIKTGFSNEAE